MADDCKVMKICGFERSLDYQWTMAGTLTKKAKGCWMT